MNQKTNKWIFPLAFLGISFLLTNSCEKNNQNDDRDIIFNPDLVYNTMQDNDGNVYKTIMIGTQTWMAENLKTTKYRNGENIPNVTDSAHWDTLTTGAFCRYNNDINIANTYGFLYNWYAVNDSRNIAPEGWHVPTDAEWSILTNYLDSNSTLGQIPMSYIAGSKLKEIGTIHWNSPNNDATNESGFTALPGGGRGFDGEFGTLTIWGYWWSTTEKNPLYSAWQYQVMDINGNFFRGTSKKSFGVSIRCIKDN